MNQLKKLDPHIVLLILVVALASFIVGSLLPIANGLDNFKFSDFTSFIGAIATAGALIFAIYQNILLRREQERQQNEVKKDRQRRDKHEKQQQSLWNFQIYPTHKKLFYEHLDKIEQKHSPMFKYIDKENLYNCIFPNNTFVACNIHITVPAESPHLFELIANYKAIYDAFCGEHISEKRLMEGFLKFCKKAYMEFGTDEVGSIKLSDTVKIDFFSPSKDILILHDVMNELLLFCGVNPQDHLPLPRSNEISNNWLDIMHGLLNSKSASNGYKPKLIETYHQTTVLIHAAKMYQDLKIANECSKELEHVLNSRSNYSSFFSYDREYYDLFRKLQNEFRDLARNNPKHTSATTLFKIASASMHIQSNTSFRWNDLRGTDNEYTRLFAGIEN